MEECVHGVHSEPCPDCIKEYEGDMERKPMNNIETHDLGGKSEDRTTISFEERAIDLIGEFIDLIGEFFGADEDCDLECMKALAQKITAMLDEMEVPGWVVKEKCNPHVLHPSFCGKCEELVFDGNEYRCIINGILGTRTAKQHEVNKGLAVKGEG